MNEVFHDWYKIDNGCKLSVHSVITVRSTIFLVPYTKMEKPTITKIFVSFMIKASLLFLLAVNCLLTSFFLNKVIAIKSLLYIYKVQKRHITFFHQLIRYNKIKLITQHLNAFF